MCASAQGAGEGGGVSIGLLAGEEADAAAEAVTYAIPLGIGELANAVLPRACHGMVVVGHGLGTLVELAHALKLGRPVAVLGSWQINGHDGEDGDRGLTREASSPQDAVEWVLDVVTRQRGRHAEEGGRPQPGAAGLMGAAPALHTDGPAPGNSRRRGGRRGAAARRGGSRPGAEP